MKAKQIHAHGTHTLRTRQMLLESNPRLPTCERMTLRLFGIARSKTTEVGVTVNSCEFDFNANFQYVEMTPKHTIVHNKRGWREGEGERGRCRESASVCT